jgi:hypothetical protein
MLFHERFINTVKVSQWRGGSLFLCSLEQFPLLTLTKVSPCSLVPLACVLGSMLEIEPATEVNKKYESYAKFPSVRNK